MVAAVKAGTMRHRVAIETPAPTQNDRGAMVASWQRSPQVWASVRTTSGDQRAASDQLVPVASHLVTIRQPLPAGVDITTASRLVWLRSEGDRHFGITAISEPDNRQRVYQLQCSELVGEDRIE
jgi:head-tail adaptor